MTPLASVEARRLFNEAFLAGLVCNCAHGYEQESKTGLPLFLAYVGIPLLLHRTYRESLPNTTATSMLSLLERKPDLTLGFPERARSLAPYVRRGIAFGLVLGMVTLDGAVLKSARPRIRTQAHTQEVKDCYDRAFLVGRWFAKAGRVEAIATLWGVSP